VKKFRYSLETVLNIKEQKQKMEKEKLALLISKYELQKNKLNEILIKINETLEKNEMNAVMGISIMNLKQFNLYLETLYEKYNEQNEILKALENEIEKERRKLSDVSKEKEALENLKEKIMKSINISHC
jgi:Flagellar FliJ protein.